MDALYHYLSHEKRLTVNMNNINQSENINIHFNKVSQTNFVDDHTPLAPTPSAAGAAQFLDQLLPKTAGVSSPEQVLIEEIKKRHLATMNTDSVSMPYLQVDSRQKMCSHYKRMCSTQTSMLMSYPS